MSRIVKFIWTLAVIMAFGLNYTIAQKTDLSALQKDYPLLTKRYGDRLQNRTAHYIFAIDISSSMRPYEQVVKQSLVKFIDAVPDGDQITIIVMSDESNTNYLELTKCATLNDKMRKNIRDIVSSNSFSFLKNGDPKDGSDGFTMAKRILESMNVVNSSELTFAYLLTDFEYWTHKNHYNKDLEDWNSLKPMLTDKHKGMMCKYGIELTLNKVNHPEAIFKKELDNIFGPLDYQQASSADMLALWFGHIINDINAHKINAMLKADWKEYLENNSISFRNSGRELNAEIEAPDCDLVSGMHIVMNSTDAKTLVNRDTANGNFGKGGVWTATVGNYEKPMTLWPSLIKEDSAAADFTVLFDSPYAEEINKLQGLCQEDEQSPDAVRLSQTHRATLPAVKVWNATLPLWLHIVIYLAVAGLIAALVYTLCIHPEKRFTSVVVKRRANGVSKQYNGETSRLPITVGAGADVDVAGANWSLTFYAKKYYPLATWLSFGKLKTGYYVKLDEGDIAEIINEYTDNTMATISRGKKAFLFPYKKGPNARVEISEGTNSNRIEIN